MTSSFPFRPSRYRDLSLLEIDSSRTLVIACDSSGGIGPKAGDVVQVPAYVVGRFGARVPLMEVLAVGAEPVAIIDTLTVELEPTGEEIRRGIVEEITVLGLDPVVALNGSSEKNIPTIQTGLGITVLGLVESAKGLMWHLQAGDSLACFGRPKVGREVSLADPEIVDLRTVTELIDSRLVREIVPVGSRGIRAEAEELARLYGLKLDWQPHGPGGSTPAELDLEKSAGPATCLLAAGDAGDLQRLGRHLGKPFWLLGDLQKR